MPPHFRALQPPSANRKHTLADSPHPPTRILCSLYLSASSASSALPAPSASLHPLPLSTFYLLSAPSACLHPLPLCTFCLSASSTSLHPLPLCTPSPPHPRLTPLHPPHRPPPTPPHPRYLSSEGGAALLTALGETGQRLVVCVDVDPWLGMQAAAIRRAPALTHGPW